MNRELPAKGRAAFTEVRRQPADTAQRRFKAAMLALHFMAALTRGLDSRQ